MIILIAMILMVSVIVWHMEFRKPTIILNYDEQKILKLLKDNIEGSTSTTNRWIDFEYIFITTNIKWLTFQYYKSFTFGGESVSLYLNGTNNKDKILISPNLEKSIIEVLKPYTNKIISEETIKINKINEERHKTIEYKLRKVLKDVEIK